MNDNIKNVGFNFDNTYANLSESLISHVKPELSKDPKLIILNDNLGKNLDLNFEHLNEKEISSLLSGNSLPRGSQSIAQAYAGHQFGFLTMLGDGRATLIGEHLNKKNERFDIQLKGSGKTPFSRNGDGRATLLSMLREYLISEAMNGLNIPTTRSLAVVSTGENVYREKIYNGGILTRVASSHIRVGTFQNLSMRGDYKTLGNLISYSLKRHFAQYPSDTNSAISLLKIVRDKQISLIVNWMRVGFIHGVMNTDNMAISGETIDYGPCAFMNAYNPNKYFSSIDKNGRYSFINQSIIAHWNISRFAETLIPFLNPSRTKAIDIGKEIINDFEDLYKKKWHKMMKDKLGFLDENKDDDKLINELLNWMEKNKADYTNTFIFIMNNTDINNEIFKNNSFIEIKNKIDQRKNLNIKPKKYSNEIMIKNNPLVIARNHLVEEALYSIDTKDDYSLFYELLNILKDPYSKKNNIKDFQNQPDSKFEKEYRTFCGT